MPLKPAPAGRLLMRVVLVAAALAGVLLLVGALDGAFAQAGPFGAPRSQARAVPIGGVLGWIFARQAEFYRALSGSIRAAKADGSAAWALFAIAFAYGVFHAAGPGHGKAVISSYLVANEETWKRGVVLSFAEVTPIKRRGQMMGPVPLWAEVAFAAVEDFTHGTAVVDGVMLGAEASDRWNGAVLRHVVLEAWLRSR